MENYFKDIELTRSEINEVTQICKTFNSICKLRALYLANNQYFNDTYDFIEIIKEDFD